MKKMIRNLAMIFLICMEMKILINLNTVLIVSAMMTITMDQRWTWKIMEKRTLMSLQQHRVSQPGAQDHRGQGNIMSQSHNTLTDFIHNNLTRRVSLPSHQQGA